MASPTADKADNNDDLWGRLSAWHPLRELKNGQGQALITGRIYECNRADDKCKSKALLTTCGESPYTLVRRAFDRKLECAYHVRMHTQEGMPMLAAYNPNAPKRAANLSVNGDLLNKAKDLDINLSATLEQALAEALKKKQREQWLAENRKAINAYNEHVDAHGVFSDDLRSF